MKLKNKETCNFAIGQPLVYRKVVLVLLRHDFLLGIVLKRSDLMLVEVDPKDLNFRLW